MKKLLYFIAMLIVIKMSLFCLLNAGVYTDVKMLFIHKTIHIKQIYLLAGSFIAGVIFTLCASYSRFVDIATSMKRHSRNAEKNLVTAEASQDKIKMLEAKVQTLEVALKEALKK
jgi:uncharacterized integral membrane protein